jgi:hypothetical protein
MAMIKRAFKLIDSNDTKYDEEKEGHHNDIENTRESFI